MSPLEHDWNTKPIIYIINNSFAFRYVTLQIWKYYGIFGYVPNERGRIHEHKALFRKQLSAQAFKVRYTPLSVRDAFRISTWSLSSGLCFQVRNSRHSLFFCWWLSNSFALLRRPFWIGGELPVFVVRPYAPNRDARTVMVWYEYMYRATPNSYWCQRLCVHQTLQNYGTNSSYHSKISLYRGKSQIRHMDHWTGCVTLSSSNHEQNYTLKNIHNIHSLRELSAAWKHFNLVKVMQIIFHLTGSFQVFITILICCNV